jgi:hypothetical protein
VRLEADRTEEAVARHGSSRLRELHKETAGQAVGRMATVDQEAGHMGTADQAVGHTVAAGHRMGREAGEAVARKAKEPVQGHHKVKEVVQVVHRRAREHPVRAVHHKAREQAVRHRVTGLVQVVHRAMAMGHCRAVAGKATDWVEEDQRAELAEKVPLLLRSKSRMRLSCQPRSSLGLSSFGFSSFGLSSSVNLALSSSNSLVNLEKKDMIAGFIDWNDRK